MAATYGRLTGKPGVCLSTLGPGALNFSTGAAYALLGAMPMILITGQKGILSSKQARFQIVDVVSSMTPLTKMARQIVSTTTIPTIVREAFRVAQQERPGPVHLGVAGGHRPGRGAGPAARAAASDRNSRCTPGGAGPRGGDDPGSRAAADHVGGGGEPAAAGRCAVRLRPSRAHPVFQYPDGQGRGGRRVESLHGNGGALRARLRA